MNSTPNDSITTGIQTVLEDAVIPRRRPWHRLRDILKQFRHDLREPLPGDAERSFGGRVGARCRYLIKRHGWKLVWAIVIYYFIRDMLLYVILPYFVARSLLN